MTFDSYMIESETSQGLLLSLWSAQACLRLDSRQLAAAKWAKVAPRLGPALRKNLPGGPHRSR